MFFLFFILINSIFIPYLNTEFSTIKTINISEINELSLKYKKIIGISINSNNKKFKIFEASFIEASIHFNNKALFVFIDSNSVSTFIKEKNVDLPAIFIYQDGFLSGLYPYHY